MTLRSSLAASWAAGCVLAVLCCAPAGAQQADPAVTLPDWAPRWREGDWWVVRTFQLDLSERTRSPEPAEGAAPVTPQDSAAEPLPGFPPLRNGVPVGYKPGNTYRFEVVRRESVDTAEGERGVPPESFWVVSVATIEGAPRAAELWYTTTELSLSRIVFDASGPRRRDLWLKGSAQLAVDASLELGFPLDWPDLPAAKEPQAKLERDGQRTVEQRVRLVGAETPQAEVRILLSEVTAKRDGPKARAMFSWRPKRPFWARLLSGTIIAETQEYGRK